MLCCIVQFHAQVAVSGIVTDNNSGHPVEFATVTLQQGDQWCMTDKQGVFTLAKLYVDKYLGKPVPTYMKDLAITGNGLSENAFQ